MVIYETCNEGNIAGDDAFLLINNRDIIFIYVNVVTANLASQDFCQLFHEIKLKI